MRSPVSLLLRLPVLRILLVLARLLSLLRLAVLSLSVSLWLTGRLPRRLAVRLLLTVLLSYRSEVGS